MNNNDHERLYNKEYQPTNVDSRSETFFYFVLTILGFSFWFYMAVPFASHRETYSWLATINRHTLSYAFGNSMSVTYRPLSQATTWMAFLILDPTRFPTSPLRQGLLQTVVYAAFALGWWFIYRAVPERRQLALISFIAGGVFCSGYVHLYHIYGLMYVPVMLMVGALLGSYAAGIFGSREWWLSAMAIVLALWHPFATALFAGFYFGFYIETFKRRSRMQHIRAIVILLIAAMVSVGLGVLFARKDAATMSLHTRLLGFLMSYQTNEVNRIASVVAFLFSLMVIHTTNLSRNAKLVASLVVTAVSVIFLWNGVPLLCLWVSAVLVKLARSQSWGAFFLMVAAALLPLGGGIGTPIFALFAIVVAVYGTILGWSQAETSLSFIKPRLVAVTAMLLLFIVVLVRAGISIPIITKVANPLLTERERTYQLETVLGWLRDSDYCSYRIAFAANGGSPIDSMDNIITRRNRPPADIDDVTKFWKTVLSCRTSDPPNEKRATALVTFGSPPGEGFTQVFKVGGKYAGEAAVWVRADSRAEECPTCKARDAVESSLSTTQMIEHRD